MGSVMDQERPWERETRPTAATMRDRIKDAYRLSGGRLEPVMDQIIMELERIQAATGPLPPSQVAPQCCMCGKKNLSTVEGDGGAECELADGRWVCSAECWDKAVSPVNHVVGGDTTFVLTNEDHIVLSETSPNAENSAGWRYDQIDWKFVKALCQAFSTRVGEGSYDQFMVPVQQRWLTAMKAALIDARTEVNPLVPAVERATATEGSGDA